MSMAIELFQWFKNSYPAKYRYPSDAPIGEGAHAHVFAAHDVDRDVADAVKLFHEGEVPTGTHRGLRITSRLSHHQVAPTHTVERFIAGDGKEYKAVVSRLIPGKSLKSVFEWWGEQEPADQLLIAEDFSKSFLPALINVLTVCHTHNYGHGDLHEGNIMTFISGFGEEWKFGAVLIDFDAESVRRDNYEPNEQNKIDSDVRLFNSRMGPYITGGWKWGSHIAPMYGHYHRMEDIQWVYGKLLNFIDHAEKDLFSEEFFLQEIKQLAPRALGGVPIKPMMLIYRGITNTTGHRALFEQAFAAVQDGILDGSLISDEATMEIVNERKHDLYRQLFP